MASPNQDTSFLSLKDWLLSLAVPLLAGVVGSQALAIERISLHQLELQTTFQEHSRQDRDRDNGIAQLRVELAKLSSTVEINKAGVQTALTALNGIEKCNLAKKNYQ